MYENDAAAFLKPRGAHGALQYRVHLTLGLLPHTTAPHCIHHKQEGVAYTRTAYDYITRAKQYFLSMQLLRAILHAFKLSRAEFGPASTLVHPVLSPSKPCYPWSC